MQACHVYDYYVSYAKHFGLVKYIKFNTEVIAIRRADDYLKSGQWCVTVRDSSAEVSVTVFDAVMVCSGLHYAGNMTDCPGLDNFKGDILHSCQMTSASRFKDKTVLVVGACVRSILIDRHSLCHKEVCRSVSRQKINALCHCRTFLAYQLEMKHRHECDKLRVSILSVRDTEEKAI